MEKTIGYQWYINYGCDQYVPQERTYTTIEESFFILFWRRAYECGAPNFGKIHNSNNF